MAAGSKWLDVDTRTLANGHWHRFDGFVHRLPRGLHRLHEISINCWCDPKVIWPEEGQGTLLVSHRNRRPAKEEA